MAERSDERRHVIEVWDSLNVGDKVSFDDILDLSGIGKGIERKTKQRIYQTLAALKKKGKMEKDGNLYVKKSNGAPKPKPDVDNANIEKYEFNMLELGEAVFEFIQDLKRENATLKKQQNEDAAEISQLSSDIHQLQGELNEAKHKIHELNNKRHGGKTASLYDLQQATKGGK